MVVTKGLLFSVLTDISDEDDTIGGSESWNNLLPALEAWRTTVTRWEREEISNCRFTLRPEGDYERVLAEYGEFTPDFEDYGMEER